MAKKKPSASKKARQIIRQAGGMIKRSEPIQPGIHPGTLYHLRDIGDLVRIFRGIYRQNEIGSVSNPDLVVFAAYSGPNLPLIPAQTCHP
ncbi:MAG TPA: type IV toxin-antitoxin system AbiEi family antitoxin domain-containing protein, partial [bacterium]|nr:type IV toxin-antitoxin system AbiEi family antitoxin domain-containing protein [bacterium]HPM99780.1 type IV toxin-antitoxin system AbiEi family antitoxin domain-containing protein [bacterium]